MTCPPCSNARVAEKSRRVRPEGLDGPREVTPAGNDTTFWSDIVESAISLEVSDLCVKQAAGRGRLIVLSAHPDDETIGAGRLISEWARRRGPVEAITLTAGEACVDHMGVVLPGLARRRVDEWRAAVRALGAQPHSCWGVPDGRAGNSVTELGSRLAGVLSEQDVVLAPWRFDPHPDHVAAGEAAWHAAHLSGAAIIEYPVWMTFWCDPTELERSGYDLFQVSTDALAERSREVALACYVSQQQPLRLDLAPVVPLAMLEHHERQLVLLPRRTHHA